jgi:hypothetical protein
VGVGVGGGGGGGGGRKKKKAYLSHGGTRVVDVHLLDVAGQPTKAAILGHAVHLHMQIQCGQ